MSIDIQALEPGLLGAYLDFFDRDAFADNPRWASCYCLYYHAPHDQKPWGERTAAENRAEVGRRILAGRMHGYLAFVEGRAVGWCNAGPRRNITTLPRQEDEGSVGAVACFIVSKSQRGTGVARSLLRAACDGFRDQGFEIAEAYPLKDAAGEAESHGGPLSLYLSEGFEPVGENDGAVVVRKRL